MNENTVKYHPILFSGPMVRAILGGRKTQTRRIIKPQPLNRVIDGLAHVTIGMEPSDDGALWYDTDCINPGKELRCPYGRFGSRLWVRETWRPVLSGLREGGFDYRADDPAASGVGFIPWKPSIHMPRKVSRITLEITGVRVERLNDINEDDAKSEGVVFGTGKPGECHTCAKGAFMDLWNSINGTDSWLQNPYVWVIEFERVAE